MVGDHHQASAGAEHLHGLGEHCAQGADLVVDLDAQGLEELSHLLFLLTRVDKGLYHGQQVGGGLDGCLGACLVDGLGYAPGLRHLAVEFQDLRQPLNGVGVDDLGGGETGVAVHAHVQGSLRKTERETALLVVEMVKAHPQVGQHAVNGLHVVKAHEI